MMIKQMLNRYLEHRVNKACSAKWKKIIAQNKHLKLSTDLKDEYLHLWKTISESPFLYYLMVYSGISGIHDYRYVPEHVYYILIEPTLNDKSFALAYADKNFYQKYIPELSGIFPATIVRKINSVYFNTSYEKIDNINDLYKLFENDKSYILKSAVETSGGEDVYVVKLNQNQSALTIEGKLGKDLSIEGIFHKYNNFIIQEKIIQDSWFSLFNESSVNTIRLFTYRSMVDNRVHFLSAVLRFGQKGQLVDNQAAGGLTIGISKDGILNDFACNKYGKVDTSKSNFISNFKTKVPFYNEMCEYAAMIAPKYHYHRLLGFDFCVTQNGEVKLLEINCKNIEINFLQMNNGPLFSSHTNEIIQFCMNNTKKVVIDYQT